MKKIILSLCFALFAGVLLPANLLYAHSADDVVLQCMADCIMQEGEAEKDTCKMRCAGLNIDMSRQPRDCMAVFKQCRKQCETDKECERACKTDLLNCV